MIKRRKIDHQEKVLDWCGRQSKWFWQNPDREFCLTTITSRQMEHLVRSRGIFSGCATALAGGAERGSCRWKLEVEPQFPKTSKRGARAIPCILHRADPAQGRPLPELFLLDGMTTPSAPPSGAPAPDEDEEAFCAEWWRYARTLKALMVELRWTPRRPSWNEWSW